MLIHATENLDAVIQRFEGGPLDGSARYQRATENAVYSLGRFFWLLGDDLYALKSSDEYEAVWEHIPQDQARDVLAAILE